MEIKFEVTQEMYVLLGRIEERINTLKIVLDVSEEEKNVGDGLLSCADWDEILDSLYPDTPKLKRFDYADVCVHVHARTCMFVLFKYFFFVLCCFVILNERKNIKLCKGIR